MMMEDKEASDAPCYLSAPEASAWASGHNAARGLFAPILAEKERVAKEAMREVAKWASEAGEAKGRLEASELAGVVDGWRDRALAAEAALAAERERCERAAFRALEGMRDEGENDIRIAQDRVAAAIRAEGE